MARKRNAVYKMARVKRSHKLWAKFKKLRNQFCKSYRQKKMNYFAEKLTGNLSDREVWSEMRPALYESSTWGSPKIKVNNETGALK